MSKILIVVSAFLLLGMFLSGKVAQNIRDDQEAERKQEVARGRTQFYISDSGESDRNIVDYLSTGLFILGLSTATAAVWLRKTD